MGSDRAFKGPGHPAGARSSRNWENVMEDQKEQDRIRRRAYEIWEREGSPDGRAEEFWQQAKTSLEKEDAEGSGIRPTAGVEADSGAAREAEAQSSATAK
jgi:hypothetical protein